MLKQRLKAVFFYKVLFGSRSISWDCSVPISFYFDENHIYHTMPARLLTLMAQMYDKERIDKALSSCRYADMMAGLQVPLFLIQYEAGEIISAPLHNNNYYQVVIEGNLSIYYIRDDGNTYSLSSGSDGYIIGELELFTEHEGIVYSEATTAL